MQAHPRICISAGHGLSSRVAGQVDPGADMVTSKNDEADFALTFSKWLVADLKSLVRWRGEVFLRDAGPYAAADDFAAKNACDLFIEMHLNSGGGTGTEVIYEDSKDRGFATYLSADIAAALGLRDRGAKRRTDLAVLTPHAGMVQVLVEMFFADKKSDVNAYRDHAEKVELAIVNRILRHYGWNTVKSLPRTWGRAKRLAYKP